MVEKNTPQKKRNYRPKATRNYLIHDVLFWRSPKTNKKYRKNKLTDRPRGHQELFNSENLICLFLLFFAYPKASTQKQKTDPEATKNYYCLFVWLNIFFWRFLAGLPKATDNKPCRPMPPVQPILSPSSWGWIVNRLFFDLVGLPKPMDEKKIKPVPCPASPLPRVWFFRRSQFFSGVWCDPGKVLANST